MRQPRHGGNLAWAAAVAGCPLSAILDFSASINPLGPPDSSLAAISSELGNIRHYPDPNYGELKQALGCFHKLPSEWIMPGNGSAELLTWAGRELARLAATVLVTPTFGDYYRALRAFNAEVLEFPMSLIKSDLSLIVDYCLTTKDKGLLLNNPHNPTGKLLTRDAILPYLKEFALVVVDEAFMDFLHPSQEQSLIEAVQEFPNLVILRSLTKFYSLPGLRFGYAIAHPQRLQEWQSWRDPWAVNCLAGAAAIAAVKDKQFQQHTWEWLPKARNNLFEGLAKIPGLQPLKGAANFLLVESKYSTSDLQHKLLKRHQIFIRDCLSFPELGDRYFRSSVRSESNNRRLVEAIKQVMGNSEQ
ncbi:L-threonine O-3-phosphate decarboxylase [Rivularia sp. PCC 7116]|uniref:threonine-phosphate decarboxylase CobD n=1 Tax=Rivularia sp. PCC 7116 TaxID=373994 RepID=UPI00029EDE84|nr:threonine-phosphate decarboxylase CobD [Rivularia sp. PCC 7116]AFY53271.1 L-threonine O-3-phosphate decarboxylase [Rivularia sp. PCC 7116]